MPPISAAVARPSTATPQVPSADSRPCSIRPISAAASVRPAGADGEDFGSKVMLTRVSTSAAAAGAAAASWPMICRAGSGAAGSSAAATESASVEPGSGAVSMVTVTHRSVGQVSQAGQPAAPVGHPCVGVGAVGQPGGGRDYPQRRGHHPGAAVQHDPVPAAVAVLGVQQRQRGQHPGQPPGRGVLGDDRDPVPGELPRGGVPPACPPQHGQGERLAAHPGQRQRRRRPARAARRTAGRPGQRRRR